MTRVTYSVRWRSALIFFLQAILVLVYVFVYGLSGSWMGYNCLMIGRFITLYPRYRGEKWLKTFGP